MHSWPLSPALSTDGTDKAPQNADVWSSSISPAFHFKRDRDLSLLSIYSALLPC